MLYQKESNSNILGKKVSKGSHSNRGMRLENLINLANSYYIENDIALIHKKATPIGVVDVIYNDKKKVINKAYFEGKSTLDYNGIYKGKYIDFDAKECNNGSSFPISNVSKHQIDHIRRVLFHKGICFLIISIDGCNYLLDGIDFINFVDTENRKSIPLDHIKEVGVLIKESYRPELDYIKAIDEKYFKEVL